MWKRVMLSILALGALFSILANGSGIVGESVTETNGVGLVQAGTGLRSLFGTVVIVLAYFVAIDPEDVAASASPASTGRRALAWLLDWLLSLGALSSVIAFIPLTAEGITTGHFQWSFERSSIRPSDWVITLTCVVLTLVGMALYWAVPVIRRAQTIGQAVAGMVVMSTAGNPPSLGRAWVRGLAQTVGPLLWLSKLISGRYWHDEYAHTKVVVTTAIQRAAA